MSRRLVLSLIATALALPATAADDARLPIVGTLGVGPTIDVAVQGDRAVVIGRGRLHIVDVRDPARPRVLGSLDGLGNTRQVAVADGVAYVSARESGLFVVDVRTATPRHLAHYDSIELATGVAVAGDVLFLAQRHFGVELVDVSDPSHPRHLSTVRTGEAQSVAYRDGLLYTGVWGTSEVVTVDVRDPRRPRLVAKVPLDGYGDGVFVHGDRLYAATGHHARAPHRNPDDPGFGRGHGLEIFSLADPARPAFLGRVKFPRFYEIGFDMWDVKVVGDTAFVGDTHNGLFVVDVRDPAAPRVASRVELPRPRPDAAHPDFVGGFDLVADHVYVAGGATALHIVAAPGLAQPVRDDPGAPPIIPPDSTPRDAGVYRPDGQVHAVAVTTRGDVAVGACGAAGLHTLRLGRTMARLHAHPSDGIVTDVALAGDTVYAAEGTAGLAIGRLEADGRLTPLGRYRVPGQPVKYVAVPGPGRVALVQVGGADLHLVDVSDPRRPRLVLQDRRPGLLYGHQLADGLLGGRYAAAFWHVSGLHWYDLQADPPAYAGQHPPGRFDPLGGVAVLGSQLLTPRDGGLVRFDQDETRPLDALPVARADRHRLTGKVAIDGRRVALTNRALGTVVLLDLGDPDHPRVLDELALDGNPGRAAFTATELLIPAGYEGLIRREFPPDEAPAPR